MRAAGRTALALLAWACGSVPAQDWSLPEAPLLGGSDLSCAYEYSNPVASYRVSEQCDLADITVLGGYTEGTAKVLEAIRGFRTESVERSLIDGKSIYQREARIELHRLLEPTAVLVCRLEMMHPVVVAARIERAAEQSGRGARKTIEMVSINAGRLPDLGVYTHGIESRRFCGIQLD